MDPAGPAPTIATREPVFNLRSSFLATHDLSFGVIQGDGKRRASLLKVTGFRVNSINPEFDYSVAWSCLFVHFNGQ